MVMMKRTTTTAHVYPDLVEVTWDDGEVDVVSIDNICEAP